MNLKKWLLRSSYFIILLLNVVNYKTQNIANYVNNGGFEELYSCSVPNNILLVKKWRSIDSLQNYSVLFSKCSGINNVPLNGYTYQFPRSGNNFVGVTLYCSNPCGPEYNRSFIRNQLKSNLTQGKIYCVKFYVNITNNSSHGIDAIGINFSDNSIDTISKPNIPLTFITPQITNINNNVITDTLNWVPITGTFVATGTEKFVLIGNFKTDALTNLTTINSATNYAASDVCFDDVSCIDIDLPAYAGPDVFCIPGNSVYIGRQRDVGIDEACMWYKLPNMTTAIDTAAGIWVSPTATSTYVVRQEICAGIKYDTVVVTMSGLGFDDMYSEMDSYFTLIPNPSKDKIELNYKLNDYAKITIQNNLGQIIGEEEINFINSKYSLNYNLPNGIYFITISNNKHKPITKKLIVHGQ